MWKAGAREGHVFSWNVLYDVEAYGICRAFFKLLGIIMVLRLVHITG